MRGFAMAHRGLEEIAMAYKELSHLNITEVGIS
jgi:hypothetical protein